MVGSFLPLGLVAAGMEALTGCFSPEGSRGAESLPSNLQRCANPRPSYPSSGTPGCILCVLQADHTLLERAARWRCKAPSP